MSTVPEITPEELVRRVDAGEPLQVLDVRPPAMAAASRIEIVPAERYANLVGSQVLGGDVFAETALDPAAPIAVVCAMGVSSRAVAEHLVRGGLRAWSLRGGMAAWAHTLVARELPAPRGIDRLLQLDRPAKGALGYLLVADGEALAVDAPRRWELYRRHAREAGARIAAVVDTHVHADYLSGGPAMAAALRVPYHLHPADAVDPWEGTRACLDFRPLADGAELTLGSTPIGVQHTPGHTPGSVSLRVGDVVLTGDFVFVRSLGRPDLGDRAAEWTRALWTSLERARREWPDALRVLPAHYASALERVPGGAVVARFAELRRDNEALRIGDEAEFTRWVEARIGGSPEAYRRIKRANLGLLELDDATADELELGRNRCAVG